MLVIFTPRAPESDAAVSKLLAGGGDMKTRTSITMLPERTCKTTLDTEQLCQERPEVGHGCGIKVLGVAREGEREAQRRSVLGTGLERRRWRGRRR